MAENEVFGTGEFRTTRGANPGVISLPGKNQATQQKAVEYSPIEGEAIFEGDIVLGNVEDIQKTIGNTDGAPIEGVVIVGVGVRWSGGIIPYEIIPSLPNQNRVTEAIEHWQNNTPIRFRVRTTESDWVVFRPGSGCKSAVGRRGGRQFITLGDSCTRGNVIHEIGHAVGLWHEQSREDRDRHITIVWDNIELEMRHNFNQHIQDGDDIGNYDYGSIMHYPTQAFAIDRTRPTIVTPQGQAIGQREGLSAGDIATVRQMYP